MCENGRCEADTQIDLIFLYNYTLSWENRALQIFLYSYTLTTSKYSMHRFEALAYGDFSNYDPELFRCLIGLISVTNYICRTRRN
ncbi:uncharacterized protein [Miscanthus floridulus]|uniref:uncharacterized protein isoform X2 n=1 Tax=Miscanthus floridulus TaxID=154761 RepID=UPI0034586774